jgi:Xaa-Pro aminopeptidase
MILSNEPGYYKTGEYGIRIENLVIVEERTVPGAERDMLGFRELTLAPIDRNLIDVALLSADERQWVDSYHRRVRAELAGQLDEPARDWLEAATTPL